MTETFQTISRAASKLSHEHVARRILAGRVSDDVRPVMTSIDAVDGTKLEIKGLDYHRGEESGSRLWSAIEQSCGGLDAALERVCVINHCPLVFLDSAGRNVAPDKWPKTAEPVRRMREVCDEHLLAVTRALTPKHIVALGKYANEAVERLIDSDRLGWTPQLHRLRHPSPLAGSAEDFSVAAISLLSRICEVTP